LSHGRLARVAVAPRFRRHNVGSTLLRHIVRHAITHGLDHLAVEAVPDDLPFYHQLGFVSAGDQGVAGESGDGTHRQAMLLPLHRFRTPRTIVVPSPITAAERRRHRLKSALDFQQAALALVARATRKLRILSHHLDPDVYDNAAFSDRVLDFAINHRETEVQILLRNPRALVQTGHRLLQLHRRLPSRIKIRRFNINCQTPHHELMLIDSSGILYNSAADGYSGYEIRSSPADATALARDFDTLWAAGEADAELREMLI
ncbi:MAG: GNAT family N-acetyltransferase, partial [Porticoccaceae bacterium]